MYSTPFVYSIGLRLALYLLVHVVPTVRQRADGRVCTDTRGGDICSSHATEPTGRVQSTQESHTDRRPSPGIQHVDMLPSSIIMLVPRFCF